MTRSVHADAAGKKGLQVTELVKTSPSSWGETDLDALFQRSEASFDAATDTKGPVPIAVVVNADLKQMGSDKQGTTRLAVYGSVEFATNREVDGTYYNRDLLLNTVDWLAGQADLLSIRPRARPRLTGAVHGRARHGDLLPLRALDSGAPADRRDRRLVAPRIAAGKRVQWSLVMRFRSTIVLILLLIGLGAYVYWVEVPKSQEEAKKKTILDFKPDDVTAVSLVYSDREIVVKKSGDEWRLTKPIDAAADSTTVKNLINAIAEAEVKKTFDERLRPGRSTGSISRSSR